MKKNILHLLILILVWSFPNFSQSQEKKPNIIMILTDEHNASIMGCAGDKQANTPNLDKLADSGILFQSNYCSSPICSPSRQSMTVGKYVSHHNVWGNNGGSPNDIASLPRILTKNGYDTYLIGGMHYEGFNYGFSSYTAEKKVTPPKDKQKTAESITPKPRTRVPAALFKSNGNEIGAEFKRMGESIETDKFVDIPKRDNALSFIRERKSDGNPFFLTIDFNAPHYPLVAPKELLDKYKDKIPMPTIPLGYLETLPLNYKHLRNERKFENIPPAIVKLARESYYARLEWIDQQIGMVLDALKSSPFADNTVVIYSSDHGENLGEHGLWWKNCLYDSGAKVPLIISFPKRWKGGQIRDKACGSVDVTQTIAELGGAVVPHDWDGNSLLPWLDDANYKWKDMAISEFYATYIASGIIMIRQGDWKYVYHNKSDEKYGAVVEFYNLKTDPKELNNLANKPKYKEKIAQMHKTLVEQLGEEPDHAESRWRNGANPEFPNGIVK